MNSETENQENENPQAAEAEAPDAETSTENAEPLSEEDAERELEEALKKAKLDRWRVPLPFILVFIIWTYAAIWQWTAFKVKDEIQDSFREYAQSGVYMQGQLMTILGFPNTYIIRYKGKITSEKADMEIPMISVNSNLRTGSPITISLPEGVQVSKGLDPAIWALDKLFVKGIIPTALPHEISRKSLWTWRQKSNGLEILDFDIEKQKLKARGRGRFYLDEHLQPSGKFSVRLQGVEDFMALLHDQDIINTKTLILSKSVLAGFSQKDPKTKESYFATEIILQNRMAYLGPLQVASFPLIHWE